MVPLLRSFASGWFNPGPRRQLKWGFLEGRKGCPWASSPIAQCFAVYSVCNFLLFPVFIEALFYISQPGLYRMHFSCSSPIRVMPDARNWDQPQDWAQQISEVIQGMRPPGSWPDPLGSSSMNLGARSRAIPLPNLQNPEVYMDFFSGMVDFALFPRLSRRPQETAAGLGGEKRARDWIQEQIRDGVRNSAQFHRESIGEIGIFSS